MVSRHVPLGMVQIRAARRDDFPGIGALLAQLNPDDPPAAAEQERVFETILQTDRLVLLVAEMEGLLVASCYLNLIPNITRGARPYAVIENVIVDIAHRQRGIGRAMMQQALDLAWQAGCYKVMLMSGRKEPAVHAFYLSCGLSPDGKQAYIRRAP